MGRSADVTFRSRSALEYGFPHQECQPKILPAVHSRPPTSVPNPVGILQELCHQLIAEPPSYKEIARKTAYDLSHISISTECKFVGVIVRGSSFTSRYAKTAAADLMLQYITKHPAVLEPYKKQHKPLHRLSAEQADQTSSAQYSSKQRSTIFPGLNSEYPDLSLLARMILSLLEMLRTIGWSAPHFDFERAGTQYQCTCSVYDRSAIGIASAKVMAKINASRELYQLLADKLEAAWYARMERNAVEARYQLASAKRYATYLGKIASSNTPTLLTLLTTDINNDDQITAEDVGAFLQLFASENNVKLRSAALSGNDNPKLADHVHVLTLTTTPNIDAVGVGATAADAQLDAEHVMLKILSRAMRTERAAINRQRAMYTAAGVAARPMM